MNHKEALDNLLAKLEAIGFGEKEIATEIIDYDGYSERCIKILRVPKDCTVEVVIGEYWEHPNDSCYFVNFSHATNGNFMACPGTNSVDVVLFNLGRAVLFAQHSDYPRAASLTIHPQA